jgi:Protein phosphatase 2C
MDGCSSGKDSHFASALMGKILQKLGQIIPHQDFYKAQKETLQPEILGKWLLENLFFEMQTIRNQLLLDRLEMLATLVLLVYQKNQKSAWLIVIGDGFIQINEEIIEIDQDNRPDYLAYHLGEGFENWFAGQKNIFRVDNPQNLSICSDGIDTFQTIKTDINEDFNPINYLLKDNTFENLPNMLNRKFNILQKQYGYQPADDVSVIRISFNNK